MAKEEQRYAQLLVYNSVTNSLDDDKFDTTKPFTFVEFLNYISTLNDDDLENLEQYKKYIKAWDTYNKKEKRNVKLSVREIYINFLNDIVLTYSTEEERRFFNTIDINDNKSLTQAIPFYSNRIKDIISYYRERRSTFKKELREVKNKGSNESIKNTIKNSVIDFYQSPNVKKSETFNLSTTFIDLDIELEEGYDTFNDYFDIDPDSVQSNETFTTNKINYNATIDFNKALVDVINQNNVVLKELAPFNISVNFNRVFSDYFRNEDFIDYDKANSVKDNYNIALEADLAKKFTGTDYYYLSSNDTSFVSGNLFETEDETSNALNINFPSFRSNISENTIFEREVGLFFEPTKYSLLRIDGEFIKKVKIDLKPNTVYVFPDPNKYGDIINTSTTKRLNPFNFYFKDNSYKNVSSSYGRKLPKSYQRSHYFHSYDSLENKRYNLNNDSSLDKNYKKLKNYGTIYKNESDIYGNEFVSFIREKNTIRNIRSGVLYNNDKPTEFESGNTIDVSENKYGKTKKDLNSIQRRRAIKFVYLNDLTTDSFLPLSSSNFNNIIKKLEFNSKLQQEVNNTIYDINLYQDTYSITTSSYNVIDGFKLTKGIYENLPEAPYIIEKGDNKLSYITNDSFVDKNIYKVKITPYALTGYNNQFYYEFFSYNTISKKQNTILDKNSINLSFFEDNFFFTDKVIFDRIDYSYLTYNSKNKEFILTTTFKDTNNGLILHVLKYNIYNNEIKIKKNSIMRDKFSISTTGNTNELSAQFVLSAIYDTPKYIGNDLNGTQRTVQFF